MQCCLRRYFSQGLTSLRLWLKPDMAGRVIEKGLVRSICFPLNISRALMKWKYGNIGLLACNCAKQAIPDSFLTSHHSANHTILKAVVSVYGQ